MAVEVNDLLSANMSGDEASVATLYAASSEGLNSSSPTADDGVSVDPYGMTADCYLYTFTIYTVVVGSFCIVGLVGNIVAFLVFWSDRIKTSTSFLFQGLSLIDSFMLISVFPIYSIESFVTYTGMFQGWYRILPFVQVYLLPLALMNQTATIWTTVLVGVNRYIAVCKPYQASRLCTVQQAKKQLAFVLLFAVFYNIPKFAEARVVMRLDNITNTTVAYPEYTVLGDTKWYLIAYNNICYLLFLFILPLLILTVLNVRLINALNALKRRRAEMQTMRQQQDNNVTLVLIIVVLVFTFCQMPALINQILWNVLPDSSRSCHGFQFYFRAVCNMLVILNSAVNFLIYFFFNKRFRQVLIGHVCKKDYTSLRPTGGNSAKNCKGSTIETLL